MIEMPDVNVLIALLDSLHVHHRTAKDWFDRASQSGWATCPLTISGALRVISRPAPPRVLSIAETGNLLRTLIEVNRDTHSCWPDDISLLDESLFDLTKLQGYRQLTDLHLLGIAHRNGGTLVTLDTGLTTAQSAVIAAASHLVHLLTP